MTQEQDFLQESFKKRILVTGGNGLVGKALQKVLEECPEKSYRQTLYEEWIFVGSKEGDLTYCLKYHFIL
jgi:hypothetical protein